MALFLKFHLRPVSFITFTYEVIYLIDINVHISILKSNSEVVDLLPAFNHAGSQIYVLTLAIFLEKLFTSHSREIFFSTFC